MPNGLKTVEPERLASIYASLSPAEKRIVDETLEFAHDGDFPNAIDTFRAYLARRKGLTNFQLLLLETHSVSYKYFRQAVLLIMDFLAHEEDFGLFD